MLSFLTKHSRSLIRFQNQLQLRCFTPPSRELAPEVVHLFTEIEEEKTSLRKVAKMLELTSNKEIEVHIADLEHPKFTKLTEELLKET